MADGVLEFALTATLYDFSMHMRYLKVFSEPVDIKPATEHEICIPEQNNDKTWRKKIKKHMVQSRI